MMDPERWAALERERGYLRVRLRLLRADEGGRKTGIVSGYRPDWDIGNVEGGRPTFNGAAVRLENADLLQPGHETTVRLLPFAPGFWLNVRSGQEIAMHEGARVVGRAVVLEAAVNSAK